jgi:hypothetical protein
MLRAAIFFVLLSVVVLLAFPFVVSSLYIDQRGITIPGQVHFKREDLVVHRSALERVAEVTIEYSKPDGSGVAFLTVRVAPAEYDGMRVGQAVRVHYLRSEDLPDLPLVKSLRRAQLLPTARLASQRIGSGLQVLLTRKVVVSLEAVALFVIVLLVWKMARIPGFSWAVAASVLLALAAVYVSEFPRPMPAPTVGLRQSIGQVKSVERITRLFAGSRSRGVLADQPMEAVGVEFTPEGRTESVLAIDLIDARSVPGLREKSAVPLSYESASPRTAYIQGATRTFVSRNLAGVAVQGIACLAVLIVLWGGTQVLGWAFRRLTRRTSV